jgi:hypothetical protein|tara:strand:- start:171 stop:377 length:207 start_codon:yes stop_codon:yes gene_type:complete
MTTLDIIKAMKANRNSMLWLNDERKEAAFHSGNGSYCTPVDYFIADMAKTDPAFGVVEDIDGKLYSAI